MLSIKKREKPAEKIHIYILLLGILICVFIFVVTVLIIRANQTYKYFQNREDSLELTKD